MTEAQGCADCRRAWVRATGPRCPLCGGALEPQPARTWPAELAVSFGISDDRVADALRRFVAGVWFPTRELDAGVLAPRAVAVWWPVWLVDARCEGRFEAEVGFDYAVRSSEEVLEAGRWTSREVMRSRTRWEPRIGTVSRRYDNVPAHAVSHQDELERRLGGFAVDRAGPIDAPDGWVLLPDRTPDEAWPQAADQLVHRVADDVRDAVEAAHVRGVTVDADWTDRRFTWLLLPLWVTWYQDEEGTRRAVWIHGETGRAWGPRMASRKRALGWSVGVATVATGVLLLAGFLAALGLALLFLLPVAAVLALVAVGLYVAALWPPLYVWRHNAREESAAAPT